MNLKTKKDKAIILAIALNFIGSVTFAQTYITKNAKVVIFSSTPIEDIKAVTDKGTGVLVQRTKEVVFQFPIKSFSFAKGLMQEHFNENYMESDKFPYAKFKGTFQQEVDFEKEGTSNVTVKGILNVHGVEKPRTITGRLAVKDGKIRITTSFDVACADHDIKIPTIVLTKVAEIIKVSFDATLNPLTK